MKVPKIASTRRFKSLVSAQNGNKRIIDKLALYDSHGNQIDVRPIQINKDGYEYIYCRNTYTKHGLFSDLPKDAYDHVKYGFGDVVTIGLIFGTTVTKVLRFIDRDYGESVRKKFLDGWKNAKFVWGINFNHKNSMNSGYVVMDGPIGPNIGFTKQLQPLTFSTQKEVIKKIEELENRANIESEKYLDHIVSKNDPKEIADATVDFFCKLFNTTREEVDSYISSSLLCAMIDELADNKLGISEYDIVLKPIQILL